MVVKPNEPMIASLYVIRGRQLGKQVSLSRPITRLGRDPNNDFQLHDTEVSRFHAEIRQENGSFLLVDLQSSNGSFINGNRITSAKLKHGDRIQFGRTLLVFSHVFIDKLNVPKESDFVAQGESEPPIIRTSLASTSLSQSDDDRTQSIPSSIAARKDRSHWEIMYHTALAVTRTSNIDDLLSQILELIVRWVQCDRGCILLVDDESGQLFVGCSRTRGESDSFDRVRISKTILDYVLSQKEGVLTGNAKEDTRWDNAASIVQLGIREAICVPMQGRYGIVGAIYIDTSTSIANIRPEEPNRFDEDHLKLMVAIGHQAALAIEDTNYYRGMLQAERLAAIGQTTAMISHHVKNILQGLRGGSYLVQEGIQKHDWELISRGWKSVERNQDRIASLVLDMLTYSKAREPQRVPSDVTIIVDEVIDVIQSRAHDLGIQIEWQKPSNFPVVLLDSEAIHRAILNLATNAIEAVESREGGKLIFRAVDWPERAQIGVEVSDNGPGIPTADLTRVFSLFESSKGARGTGLGLPVSQKIAQEHGGEITVASQVNEGTTFTLKLPRLIPETATPRSRIEDVPTQF